MLRPPPPPRLDGATSVALASDIAITFSEAVDVTDPWFTISCTGSGGHTAAVSGGPTAFTLNPDADFGNGETCTVTVTAANVADQDALDPANNWRPTTSSRSTRSA